MPSKFRKAIGAVKDRTSISIAKVYANNNPSKTNLEVVILKATRHDEAPIDDRYIKEILYQISSCKAQATACAQIISRRIGKTRNWIVALKSLMLVLRVFQDGDPYFPKEVVHSMKRGGKILNLSTFRDDSHSSSWDYTAFVRTFALYLHERLDFLISGKLVGRFTANSRRNGHRRSRSGADPVCGMKPSSLLDQIPFWQILLDRVIATKPAGSAKVNKLVRVALSAVVQESFDLYRDISDGLALILDSFFHLPYQSCVDAFQCCVKATKQFEELSCFYELCKSLCVGRTSEYPSVQKISDELLETLREFLKDQASFPSNYRPPLVMNSSESGGFDAGNSSERGSELGSMRTSPCTPVTVSSSNSMFDLVSLEGWPAEDQATGWEVVLAETAGNQPLQTSTAGFEPSTGEIFIDNRRKPMEDSLPESHYNPFLQDTIEMPSIDQRVYPVDDVFPAAAPTFVAADPDGALLVQNDEDPFAPWPRKMANIYEFNGQMDQQIMMQEQQLWLQNQHKIIAKNMII